MSDLSDLQAVGEDLVPIFKRLFELPDLLADDDDTSAEAAVITRLRTVTTEANQPTRGDLLSRAEAVVSSREALTEIIIQANDRTKALEETKLRIVEAQHNALGASFGRLLEQSSKLLGDVGPGRSVEFDLGQGGGGNFWPMKRKACTLSHK